MLKQYQFAYEIGGRYLATSLSEAIQELEILQSNINTSIEEIEYALAKPYYANVYLNNSLRFLKGEQ